MWLLPLAHLGALYSKSNMWCCYENTGQFYQCRVCWGEQIHNVPVHNMKCQQYRHWQYTDTSGHTQTTAMTFIELSMFVCACARAHKSVWVDFWKGLPYSGVVCSSRCGKMKKCYFHLQELWQKILIHKHFSMMNVRWWHDKKKTKQTEI